MDVPHRIRVLTALVLYFLLDLPGARPSLALDDLLPRLAGAWSAFDLVQVRAKEAAGGAYVESLVRVREAAGRVGEAARLRRAPGGLEQGAQSGRPLVLANDRLDVALAAGVDGVHGGAADLPPEAVRDAVADPNLVVGLTCHTRRELRSAPDRGADYVGLGAFFASRTKPGGPRDARAALRGVTGTYPLPIYAVGGITLDDLPAVVAEPRIAGIVVSAAIQAARDPARAAAEWRAALDRT